MRIVRAAPNKRAIGGRARSRNPFKLLEAFSVRVRWFETRLHRSDECCSKLISCIQRVIMSDLGAGCGGAVLLLLGAIALGLRRAGGLLARVHVSRMLHLRILNAG